MLEGFGLQALFSSLATATGDFKRRLHLVLTELLQSDTCLPLTASPEALPTWAAALGPESTEDAQLIALHSLQQLVLRHACAVSLISGRESLVPSIVAGLASESTKVGQATVQCLRAAALALQGDAPALSSLVAALASAADGGIAGPRKHHALLALAGDASHTATVLQEGGHLQAVFSALSPVDPLAALAALEDVWHLARSVGGLRAALSAGADTPPPLHALLALAGATPPPLVSASALPTLQLSSPAASADCDPFLGPAALSAAAACVRTGVQTCLSAVAGRTANADALQACPSTSAVADTLRPLLGVGRAVLDTSVAWLQGGAEAAPALQAIGDACGAHPLLLAAVCASPHAVSALAGALVSRDDSVRDAALHAVAHILASASQMGHALGVPGPRLPADATPQSAELSWFETALLSLQAAAGDGAGADTGAADAAPSPAAAKPASLGDAASVASDPPGDGTGGGDGLLPSQVASLPLLLSDGAQRLVRHVEAAMARAAPGDASKAGLVPLSHGCIVAPFSSPNDAGYALLAALQAQPTSWGVQCLLHSSAEFTSWLTAPPASTLTAMVHRRRLSLLRGILSHPQAMEAAGAALLEALASSAAMAESGKAAHDPGVASAAM